MSNEIENKNYRNGEQDRRITELEKHQITYNKEMGEVQVDIAGIKKDVKWLKQFFWIIATASIAGLLSQVFNISI